MQWNVKIKLAVIFLLTGCMALSFVGCGKPKAGQAFAAPIFDEPVSLDPQIARSGAERTVAVNCYEGLVAVGADGKIINGAAESYTVSPDGLTYRFTLRKDAQWCLFSKNKAFLKKALGDDYEKQFNTAVQADDFVFALQRVLDAQTESPDAYLFSALYSVQAPDSQTLEIQLSYPDENFLYALTAPGAMPCSRAFFELTNGRYGLETSYILSNGPLHVSTWLEKTSVKLSKNEQYKGERAVKPASVTLYYNKDSTALADKMADEIYDVAFLSEAQWKSLPKQKLYHAQQMTDTTLAFLFNQNVSALQNENLRLALCKALSPDALPFPEGAVRAEGIVPPFCKVGTQALRTEANGPAAVPAYSLSLARAHFSEALLELGANAVETGVLCTPETETFVRAVLQAWQKTLGVKFVASVTVLPQNELETAVADGKYEIALCPVRAGSAFASDFLEQFAGGNPLGFASADFTAILDRMHREKGNYDRLRAACTDAEDYLLRHAVLFPVQYENNYFITGRDTDGIYFNGSRDDVYFVQAGKK